MTHLFNSGPDGACPQLATLASGRPHPDLQKECCTSLVARHSIDCFRWHGHISDPANSYFYRPCILPSAPVNMPAARGPELIQGTASTGLLPISTGSARSDHRLRMQYIRPPRAGGSLGTDPSFRDSAGLVWPGGRGTAAACRGTTWPCAACVLEEAATASKGILREGEAGVVDVAANRLDRVKTPHREHPRRQCSP